MSYALSDSIRLYGTDEPVQRSRVLRAGPLSLEFEAGNLRYIRYRDREIIRAVSFVVRDKNWATYAPQIRNLDIQEESDGFRISYEATVGGEKQAFRYAAVIEGASDGSLRFSAKGAPSTDFLTNRTGFVVLHPIRGIAGAPCVVEHVDGSKEKTSFPLLINPVQPMSALRAITHEFLPGLKVTCRMEGDTFEMEDQRNWTDASYKTYVRPLALPWPYLIGKGETVDQSVSLEVSGPVTAIETVETRTRLTVSGRRTARTMPGLGFGLDPKDIVATEQSLNVLREAAPCHMVCLYDSRLGHSENDLKRMAALGKAIGTDLWLEFVIPSVDNFEQDLQGLGRALTKLGNPFGAVMISPASDLKCTLPGSPWPPCPPLDACYKAARAALPDVRLGGGMFSFFTELNRKRPPVELIDFVTFTTVAIFHAGDDRSAMESLESLPHLAESVQSFTGGKPYHVGPSAIGLRMNPYGEAPMPNPQNIRQAMNGMDPRQRGLFAAAWSLGFVARFAEGGSEAITLGSGVGAFGIAYAKMEYPQPYFDEKGGVYPAYHVFRGLAALKGQPLVDLAVSNPCEIQAIAAERENGIEVWIANLTSRIKPIEFATEFTGHAAILTASEFESATQDHSAMNSMEREFTDKQIVLAPYAVARLRSRRR